MCRLRPLVRPTSWQAAGDGVQTSVVLRARFGARVKAALKDKGISAGDLAARAKLSVRRVDSILRGTLARLTLKDMDLIAGALGTPLFTLLAPDDVAIAATALKKVEESGASDA